MKILQVIFIPIFTFSAQAALPEWVTNIGPCEPSVICVVGSGSTLKESALEGRSELAKYFETNIKVKSSSTSTTEQKEISLNSAKFAEWTSKVINEEAEEILSGSEVVRTEQVGTEYFSLVSISKKLLEKSLRTKINELDKENEGLLLRDSRFVYPLILINLKKRNYYTERFGLVSTEQVKSKVDADLILNLITKLPVQKMSVISSTKKNPSSLLHSLEKIFGPLKVVFVSKKQNPAYRLRTQLTFEEQYFKVEGFKKLNIIFKLELADKGEKVLGRISASSVQTARSFDQALDKGLAEIEIQLRENLDQLSSDK